MLPSREVLQPLKGRAAWTNKTTTSEARVKDVVDDEQQLHEERVTSSLAGSEM